MRKDILNVALIVIAFSLIWQTFVAKPQVKEGEKSPVNEEFLMQAKKDSFVVGRDSSPILIDLINNNNQDIEILPCTEEMIFTVQKSNESKAESVCDENLENLVIRANESMAVDLLAHNYEFFSEAGNYVISLNWQTIEGDLRESQVILQFEEPSLFTKGFRFLIYEPIYNALAALAYYLPGRNVGLAIILLTIFIRTLLLGPTNKAMKSQKALQEIQPKLKSIQEKYKGNQQKIAEETMKIWKEHKVSPMGSCLPLILQAPIMIGVFYAVRSGFNPDHQHLIYNFLSQVDLGHLNTNFYGLLELTERNVFVLPLLVGVLQFFQIKLSMLNKKQSDAHKKDAKKKDTKKKTSSEMEQSMQMMQSSMLYVMPVMIGVFAATLPSGIGLYWASSTLYGVGQQMYINKHSKK